MGDGMFGKFKALIGVEDVEEDIEEIEPVPKYEEQVKNIERVPTYTPPKPIERREPVNNNVVSMGTPSSKKQFKMVIIEPKSYEDSRKLVDSLKNNRPIIINLERIESDIAKKIFDFLSGATYALEGNVQKVANNIFVFAPPNVDVMAPAPTPKPPQQKPQVKDPEQSGYNWKK